MKRIKWILLISVVMIGIMHQVYAISEEYFVKRLVMQPTNVPSLQRGAQIYFNYCSACHSLRYENYQHIAQLVGLDIHRQPLYLLLVKKSFLFDPAGDVHHAVIAGMSTQDAQKWFGVAPPDLTNITLVHSPAWVYNFLRGFYDDATQSTGANNIWIPNTKMPNVLLPLRGETRALFDKGGFVGFITTKPGKMKPLDFDRAMYDLVNFLNLTAEPMQIIRVWIGIGVLALLILFVLLVYFWRSTFNYKEK